MKANHGRHGVVLVKRLPLWFFHLSVGYQRPVRSLRDVPEEELERISSRGITFLWLIGVWERSKASKRLKELMGKKDVLGSAYAITAYRVDPSAGTRGDLLSFRRRLHRYGVGLMVDVVPNHTAIDSDWVYAHPDWFISTRESPFPWYRFSGENLSSHPHIEIRVEDGYYTRKDAAVVFERRDSRTGEVRYLYHGNDNQSVPWNDTAQLDYTRRDLREEMLRTIRRVGEAADGIRFDAAMLLMRDQYRRLWFPAPGEGTMVPSRERFSLGDEEFSALYPREFWDEVEEVCLDLPHLFTVAEVFWGLQDACASRFFFDAVYDASFATHVAKEENSRFQDRLRDLARRPERAGRMLFYLSSPDDLPPLMRYDPLRKYQGAVVFLTTLPGSILFTHGQWEGFREKYEMDGKSPGWEEGAELEAWHDETITPLLKERELFARPERWEVCRFSTEGRFVEDVFSFFSQRGGRRHLVCYNNSASPRNGVVLKEGGWRPPSGGGRRLSWYDRISGRRGGGDLHVVEREGLPLALAPYQAVVLELSYE
ncbi:alpha amylase catalytic region [Spirochaeta thermophila DSM 6578]|uniref:Alpha amylase catalytic region n=1 Tax=Winmispira thermophila (strain ATCC 700085 / DSM 6578 / Z-1203) TaxID=869211 RepID=G0GBE8_WINT7|nr:alpha amylase catalytic region [Spirochaeta thermophila DSM 6578]